MNKIKKYSWDCYSSVGTEHPAFITFNSGIENDINYFPYKKLLTLHITIKQKMDNGLPEQDEFVYLHKIEDESDEFLYNLNNNIKIGKVSSDGCVMFYYYGDFDVNEIEFFVEKMIKKYDYELKFSVKECDVKEFYWNFLYPSEIEWQLVVNNRLLMQLSKSGDSLISPRRVDHLIKFKDENKYQEFALWARKNGYHVEERREIGSDDDEEGGYEYSALLSHEINLIGDSIDNITLFLYQKAKEYEGDYDGWGSLVVADSSVKD